MILILFIKIHNILLMIQSQKEKFNEIDIKFTESLHKDDIETINKKIFPLELKNGIFPPRFNKEIKGIIFPKSIESINFGFHFDQPESPGTIGGSLLVILWACG